MAQGSRPDRVGEQIRQAISEMLLRDVRDPGIGFVTLSRVKVSPDLQLVRVYYTQIGDAKAKQATVKALERATPFMRRQLADVVRLRRVPELRFEFDAGAEHQERIETILLELQKEREAREQEHPIDDSIEKDDSLSHDEGAPKDGDE
ncbi:MAG TPA: 30S ribosome-binding factor RbfA [Vicinamibacterales bacterium]|nr:30S ribosome-binding factor RbfA [Vicinamibacterales bacterium]